MILLVPTRILAIFDHRFTMTFATNMYFILKNHAKNSLVEFANNHYTNHLMINYHP